jgi:hypothetical protein
MDQARTAAHDPAEARRDLDTWGHLGCLDLPNREEERVNTPTSSA